MRLLIISDSHGKSTDILMAIKKEDPDACIFLGDGLKDLEVVETLYPNLPLYKVAGNCDFSQDVPKDGMHTFSGVDIFYTHGDLYDVNFNTDELYHSAKKKGANVALYGHTHIPFYDYKKGIHIFNPGSISFPRATKTPTYGIITIINEKPSFEVKEI